MFCTGPFALYTQLSDTLNTKVSLLNKEAFLDAMGIDRWSKASPAAKRLAILIDAGSAIDEQHPIIASVIQILEHDTNAIDVTTSYRKDCGVFWDMRLRKLPKVSCTLSSPPLAQLEGNVEAKKALWQMIYER